MRETGYETLLGRLLDDDLSTEQAEALLKIVRDDPVKLEDMCRHLEIWQVFSELVCPHRDTERFVESLHTRIEADGDAERFLHELEKRIDQDASEESRAMTVEPSDRLETQTQPLHCDADEGPDFLAPLEPDIAAIRRRAEQQLNDFLAERERELRAQRALGRADGSVISDLQGALEGIAHRVDSALTFSAKAIVACSVVLVVFLCMWATIHYVQAHRTVAVLGRTVNAQWAQTPDSNELCPGSLVLQQGLAELNFTKGTRLIVQAPCEFRLASTQRVVCIAGAMTAHVPPSALGFTIETPSARIVDYGTEFGVSVDTDLQSAVHVFDGQVGVRSAGRRGSSLSQRLKEGQNALATVAQGVKVGKADGKSTRFVRDFPKARQFGIPGKRLSLADVVGGGNGLGTGHPHGAIDVITGVLLTHYVEGTPERYWDRRKAQDYPYRRCPELDYVDGVFVPIASSGVLLVSSEGHTFAMPSEPEIKDFRNGIENACSPGAETLLDGQRYDSAGRPAILMRRNQGITFDLDAIREDLPGATIGRFTALCGIASPDGQLNEKPTSVDIYVVIDGKQRYARQDVSPNSETAAIAVAIQETDRFLTLITVFEKIARFNRVVLALPALELKETGRSGPR